MQSTPSARGVSFLCDRFRHVAREVTDHSHEHAARAKRQTGGERGYRLTTALLADSYIRLCHDPLKYLNRWIAETAFSAPYTKTSLYQEAAHGIQRASVMEDGRGIRGDPLHQMQGGLDADRRGRFDHVLPSRPAAGADGHDGLRPVSAERRDRLESAQSSCIGDEAVADFSSEFAAVRSEFASRMAAARQSLSPQEAAALIRRLCDEQALAMRTITERLRAARRSQSERIHFRTAVNMRRHSDLV